MGPAVIAAAVAAAATVAGTVISATSASQSAEATKASNTYQSEVAAVNAQIAQKNAATEAASGEQAAATEGLKTRSQVGAIKAAQAAGNVEVTSGSNVDVQSSAAQLGQLNTLTTQSNYEQKVYGYQTQAETYLAQSELYKMGASSAAAAEPLAVTGAAASGISSLASQATSYYKSGSGSGGTAALSTGSGSSGSSFDPWAGNTM